MAEHSSLDSPLIPSQILSRNRAKFLPFRVEVYGAVHQKDGRRCRVEYDYSASNKNYLVIKDFYPVTTHYPYLRLFDFR